MPSQIVIAVKKFRTAVPDKDVRTTFATRSAAR